MLLGVKFNIDVVILPNCPALGKQSQKKICFDLDIVETALPPPPPVFLDTYEERFVRTKKCRKESF